MYEIDAVQAQKDFYKIIKMVNEKSIPIGVKGQTESDSVVIMSARYYRTIQNKLNNVTTEK